MASSLPSLTPAPLEQSPKSNPRRMSGAPSFHGEPCEYTIKAEYRLELHLGGQLHARLDEIFLARDADGQHTIFLMPCFAAAKNRQISAVWVFSRSSYCIAEHAKQPN